MAEITQDGYAAVMKALGELDRTLLLLEKPQRTNVAGGFLVLKARAEIETIKLLLGDPNPPRPNLQTGPGQFGWSGGPGEPYGS